MPRPLLIRAAARLLLLGAGACACRAQLGGGAPGAPADAARAAAGFRVVERGEPGPITALAFQAPYIYAGSARGLRRCDVGTDEYEWVDAVTTLAGGKVSALGADGKGNLWVATENGLARLSHVGDVERLEPVNALAGIRLLAPIDGGIRPAAWAAGAQGLYRLDGRRATLVERLRDVAVTSLDRDGGGRAVWVGTRGQGLFRVEDDRVEQALGAQQVGALDEIVGTALNAAGTRLVAGRAAPDGAARLVMLTGDGPLAFQAQPETPAVRLLDGGGDAVLVAGPPGAERAFTLRPLGRGAPPPDGGFRLVPVGRPGADRWAAVPLPAVPPPRVTAAAVGGGGLYFGTERMGVARAAPEHPRYLSGAALVGDAERLYVACLARERCFVVTEGPHAWHTDGDRYAEAFVGEAQGGEVLAVVNDAAGALYALSGEHGFTGLVITELRSGGWEAWKKVLRVPVKMPAPGPPKVSMAAVSPEGILWVGLRAGDAEGREETVGYGAVEIDLATHAVTQHRPLAAGEKAKAGTLALPAALTGVFFDGPALWFSSLAGVTRLEGGQVRTWGENEHMPSELVHGLGRGADGTIWAATSEGLARFDGKEWRGRGLGDERAAEIPRALVRDARGRTWLATSRGLRVLAPGQAKVQVDSAAREDAVVDGDMRDVVLDRFGRVWALGAAAIALVDATVAQGVP